MAPTVRAFNVTGQEGNSPANNTVTKPTGTTSGDLLVAVIATDETSNTWLTYPSGFAEPATNGKSTQTATQPKFQVATKVAGGSEPASYAFPIPAFMSNIVWLFAVQGVTGTAIVVPSVVQRATTASCVAPSITYATHQATDPLVITAHAAIVEYTARTFSTPSGMSTAGGAINGAWMYGAAFSIALTGNVDSTARTSTISAAEPNTGLSLVIGSPAAPATPKGLFRQF